MSAEVAKSTKKSTKIKIKSDVVLTESELKKKALKGTVTIKDVCSLSKATENFVIPADRNIYGVEFTRFILRNMENNQKLIDVGGQPQEAKVPDKNPDEARFVRYNLRKDILKLRTIGA